MKKIFGGVLLALVLGVAALPAGAAGRFITVASTTSTQNSGLLDYLLPIFTKKTGIEVHVVAVGTGQAIRIAKNGDADVLLVHHRPSEEKFVAQGYGVRRYDVMYNDFIIVGPQNDPAHIKGCQSAEGALKKIAAAKTPFASRGDNSGTYKKEQELWKNAGIDINKASGTWYRSTGSGMGATLNTAASMNAYALSDRGTWISFKNKADLKILCEGDKALFNPYGVILVNPKRFPQVKAKDGQTFIDWLISPEGQKVIGSYRLHGKLLFTPDANAG